MTMEGSCRCGAVRYALTIDTTPPVYCCHCTDCQSWTGTAFSEQILVPATALTVFGTVIDYHYETPSGAQSHHRMCGTCHARVFNSNARLPGFVVMRAGTLDASAELEPRLHIWTASKQPWVVIADTIPMFETNAPPAEFLRLIAQ